MDVDAKLQGELMDGGGVFPLAARSTKGVEEEDPSAPRESLVQYREPELAKPAASAQAKKQHDVRTQTQARRATRLEVCASCSRSCALVL
jgi:hypothetical protein